MECELSQTPKHGHQVPAFGASSREVFEILCKGQDTISSASLKRFLASIDLPNDLMTELLTVADPHHTGKISYIQFKGCCEHFLQEDQSDSDFDLDTYEDSEEEENVKIQTRSTGESSGRTVGLQQHLAALEKMQRDHEDELTRIRDSAQRDAQRLQERCAELDRRNKEMLLDAIERQRRTETAAKERGREKPKVESEQAKGRDGEGRACPDAPSKSNALHEELAADLTQQLDANMLLRAELKHAHSALEEHRHAASLAEQKLKAEVVAANNKMQQLVTAMTNQKRELEQAKQDLRHWRHIQQAHEDGIGVNAKHRHTPGVSLDEEISTARDTGFRVEFQRMSDEVVVDEKGYVYFLIKPTFGKIPFAWWDVIGIFDADTPGEATTHWVCYKSCRRTTFRDVGKGWMQARIRVRAMTRGPALRRPVQLRYVWHFGFGSEANTYRVIGRSTTFTLTMNTTATYLTRPLPSPVSKALSASEGAREVVGTCLGSWVRRMFPVLQRQVKERSVLKAFQSGNEESDKS